MRSPRRVLVVRTSRFVGDAVAWAHAEWPAAAIRVAHQPGAAIEAELDRAGVESHDRIEIAQGSAVTTWSLLRSTWGWHALVWRPDAVVIQWWNERGEGHERTDFAAMTLTPRGFFVCFEGGGATFVPSRRRLRRSFAVVVRRIAGLALVTAIAVATVALWPTAQWHRARERRRVAAAS